MAKDVQEHLPLISSMLQAVLAGRESDFLEHEFQEHLPKDIPEADRGKEAEKFRNQLNLVRETLVTERMKGRYTLKMTSKAPVFAELDWDIKLKTDDASRNENWTVLPYTTLKLKFQKEFSDSPFALFGGSTFDSVQINCMVDEIDYLLRELSKVRDRLAQREENL